MKQAVLTAQQRLEATQNGQAQQLAPDFFNALANAQGESSDPVNSLTLQQADWLARNGASQTAGMHVGNGLGMLTSFSTSVGQQPTVALPLNSPQWGAEFGRQFVSIAQGAANTPHTVEMRLDPPDLGPLRISISLHDNTAQASFVSPHAVVRQTVENALPQLQQALAQAGIALGQASVSDQGQPQQAFNQAASGNGNGSGANSGNGMAGASGTGMAGSAVNAAGARALNPNALVDTFA
jgi:flagellar hook-length control protein FliK